MIEEAMAQLTAALHKNTDALNKQIHAMDAAVAVVLAEVKGAGKDVSEPEMLAKPIAKPVAAAAAKPAAKPVAKPVAAKGPATLDAFTKEFVEYLQTEDEDTLSERKEQISATIKHFGVARISLIGKDDWAEALRYLNEFKNSGRASFMVEDNGEEDEGDALV